MIIMGKEIKLIKVLKNGKTKETLFEFKDFKEKMFVKVQFFRPDTILILDDNKDLWLLQL